MSTVISVSQRTLAAVSRTPHKADPHSHPGGKSGSAAAGLDILTEAD